MNIDYNTYELTGNQKVRVVLAAYIMIFFICMLFYHSLLLSAVCGTASVFLLDPCRKYMARKRRALLVRQFKDLLYSLAASIATGRHMTEAMAEGAENLRMIYDENSPLVRELGYIVRCAGENRGNEETLLVDFAQRSGSEDIRNFVDVYLACRETGGDMGRVISGASEIIADKMAVEREIKALTSQKQYEGSIITAMPLAVVLFLNVFSPDYLESMYTTLEGRLIMTLALGGIILAFYMTRKLIRIEV